MNGELLKTVGGSTGPDLSEGLVAHYLLNNNADDIAGTYDASVTGSPDFQGDMTYFDGTDDSFYDGYGITSNGFTLSLWVKYDGTTETLRINTNAYASAYYGVLIDLGDGTIILSQGDGTGTGPGDRKTYTATVSGIGDNTLKHIILTYTSFDNFSMRVDDTAVSFSYSSGTATSIAYGTYKLQLAANILNTVFTECYISNVRIYDSVKDGTFITALYNEGYYPKPLTEPTTTNLLAHYPLTGTGEDVTGNYDATEVGISYIYDIEFGSVADYSSDYHQIGQNISAFKVSELTISAWVKVDSTGTTQRIFCNHTYPSGLGSTSNGGCDLFVWSDGYFGGQFLILNGEENTDSNNNTFDTYGVYVKSTNTLTTGVWYHLVLTINSNVMKLYINGSLDVSVTATQSIRYSTQTTTYALIGCRRYSTVTDSFIDGKIRNTRFYTSELTSQQITDIYEYEKHFRHIDIDDDLVAYYPLAENSLDNYNNQYDITVGSPTYNGTYANHDGTNADVLKYGRIDSLQTLNNTIGCWVNIDVTDVNQSIIDNQVRAVASGSANNEGCEIIYSTSTGKFVGLYLVNTSEEVTDSNNNTYTTYAIGAYSSITPISGTWYHLMFVMTNDGKRGELYINGELDCYVESTQSIQWQTSTTYYGNVCVGGRVSDASTTQLPLNGQTGRARFYSKALTQEQVKAIYDNEKGDFI